MDYRDLIEALSEPSNCRVCNGCPYIDNCPVIEDRSCALGLLLVDTMKQARNELCQRCGKYAQAHNGTCDGCKWRGAI